MNEIIIQILGKEEAKSYIKKHPYLETKECQKWINEVYLRTTGKKGFTKKNFITHVSRIHSYLQFTGLSPTELIDEAEEDSMKPRRERMNPAGIKIKNFFNHLKKTGRAPKSCESYAGTIRGFYRHNGFPIQVHIPRQYETLPKIELNKEIIREVFNNTQKLRDKTIILIMVSSGMSIEDVLDLKYKDIKEQLENNETPLKIESSRVKNNQKYITFFSTECVKIIKQFIKPRLRKIKPNDYIFISIHHIPLSYLAFRRILIDISKKTVGDNRINTKSFRRFFSTEMKKAGFPTDWVEYMMGHSIGISKSYLNSGVLREMYKAKENVVTILTTVVKEKAEDIRKEVEAKYQAKFEKYENIIDQLQAQIETINQRLSQ